MKKLSLLIAITLSLSACYDIEKIRTDIEKVRTKDPYNTLCIDGVTYVAFKEIGYGFLSVKLNRESKIIECSQVEEAL